MGAEEVRHSGVGVRGADVDLHDQVAVAEEGHCSRRPCVVWYIQKVQRLHTTVVAVIRSLFCVLTVNFASALHIVTMTVPVIVTVTCILCDRYTA